MVTLKFAARPAAAMFKLAGRVVAALTMAALLTLGLGTVGASASATTAAQPATVAIAQAQSAPTPQPIVAHVSTAPAVHVALATPWSKTWAFTQCIFGSGVPIGLAIAIATTPSVLAWFAGRTINAPLGYGWAISYWKWLKSRCAYALF